MTAPTTAPETAAPKELTSKDWLGKATAGFFAGFTLALALTCSFGWFFMDKGDAYFSAQGQMAMWLMSPLWSLILSFCFLFGSGLRAWGWLGLANLIAWGAYLALRLFA